MTCSAPDCTRVVWFTAEGLCRHHGIAADLHLAAGEYVVADQAAEEDLWTVPAEMPPPAPSKPKRKPRTTKSTVTPPASLETITIEGDPDHGI